MEKMNSFSTLALALLMSLFFGSLLTIEGSLGSEKVTVNITNGLGSHDQLTVHCKSGDDDLGVHQLPSSASYDFSFRPNFFGTTLFFCSFQWPGWSHSFEIYKDSIDSKRCHETLCSWIVSEQGLCLFNYDTNKFDICYMWEFK